jgi:hypothetical protein
VLRPPPICSRGFGNTPYSTSDAEAKVERASKRMANPQPIPSIVSIDVVSRCATFSHRSHSGSVLHGGWSSPLRIEATDLVSVGEENSSADLESSIMLYNFGLAHLCMAKLAKTTVNLKEGALKEGALTLFNMAYSILAPLCDQEGHRTREDMVLLAAITLNNIVALLTQMGMHSDANELARLGRAIHGFQGSNLEDQLAAAGAA